MPESGGKVEVTVEKKNNNQDFKFGIRTIGKGNFVKNFSEQPTAVDAKEFEGLKEEVELAHRATIQTFSINIIDNNDWNPDTFFFVELYDVDTNERLSGDDTITKVTILDNDVPGSLGFEMGNITVNKMSETLDIKVMRVNGTSGEISCMIQTSQFHQDTNNPANAIEFEDFLPLQEKVVFADGESEKVVTLKFINEKNPVIHEDKIGKTNDDDPLDDEDYPEDIMLKVVIVKAVPEYVKISKIKTCIVMIMQNREQEQDALEGEKMLEYYLTTREPSWGQQFKNAVLLTPQIEDDLVVT